MNTQERLQEIQSKIDALLAESNAIRDSMESLAERHYRITQQIYALVNEKYNSHYDVWKSLEQ